MQRVAKGGALVAMIVRPVSLAEIVAVWGAAIRVVPVHPRASDDASRLLVSLRKNGRSDLAIGPAMVLHEADGSFTAPAAAILNEGASLQTALRTHT